MAHLLVVIPVSVEVKKLNGAPITVFSNLSCRTVQVTGIIIESKYQQQPMRPMVASPTRKEYIPK